jgi:hypothetical protein
MAEFTRKQLYKLVWSKSAVKLSKELGVSDVMIAKTCKKHKIPKPPLGYWAKLAHGHDVSRPPLPKLSDEYLDRIEITPQPDYMRPSTLSDETKAIVRDLKSDANKIIVPEAIEERHPLVAKTETSLRTAKASKEGLVSPKARKCLDVQIGLASIDRAMRILHTLIVSLEARGMQVDVKDEEYTRLTLVEVQNETFTLRLRESLSERALELTPAQKQENAKHRYFPTYPTHETYANGQLTLTIGEKGHYRQRRWSELDGRPLEERLNSVVAWFYMECERIRQRRAAREEQERQWAEEQRIREEQERRREEKERRAREEQQRRKNLENDALMWERARLIRNYVRAAEQSAIRRSVDVSENSEMGKWLAWARMHADSIDPMKNHP